MEAVARELEQLIEKLDLAVREVCRVKGYKYSPKARPPASESQIAAYETHLGLRLPSDYRMFLRLHNGYDWLVIFGHVLSIEELLPGGKEHEFIRKWKRDSAKYGGGEVLDAIVIAELGEPSSYVYLDPNKPLGDAGLTVVQADAESSQEYPGLIAFFEGTLASCTEIIGAASSKK